VVDPVKVTVTGQGGGVVVSKGNGMVTTVFAVDYMLVSSKVRNSGNL